MPVDINAFCSIFNPFIPSPSYLFNSQKPKQGLLLYISFILLIGTRSSFRTRITIEPFLNFWAIFFFVQPPIYIWSVALRITIYTKVIDSICIL